MGKKYYIGIDMGTDSVGWAVTDEEYRLIKARGQELWGSYLFDEAQGAQERRGYRTARRRTARVRQRIMLLQSLFQDEMAKKDPLFFLRLNNSALLKEDKDERLTTDSALFADPGFGDKEYFSKYRTVYHLRAALIDGEIKDIRLLYLAVHHIIKNRGHFLFEEQSFEAGGTGAVRQKFSEMNAFLSDREKETFDLSAEEGALDVLKNKKMSKRDRQKELSELFKAGKDKTLNALIRLMTGGTANMKDLFEDYEGEKKSFSFDVPSFEESEFPALQQEVGAEEAEIIMLAKAVYDWTVLAGIMGEESYISRAKVRMYDKHRKVLARLKDYIRENCPERYKEVFYKDDKKCNYAAYIGSDRKKSVKRCGKDEFYKFLKNDIKIADEDILADIEKGDFLLKQVSNANGVVPYQVNLQELKAILDNAARYFKFLEREEAGITVKDKIIMLMTFRIPYYVGPLDTHSNFAWAVRREGQKHTRVTPWNFDEVIDKDASEQEFITRMTNKCTYLTGEDVLPAHSLLYGEFSFLNELNNLRINGEQNERARRLIYDYAKAHKKVTIKACRTLLVQHGILPKESESEKVFSGTDGDFKNSLSSYIDLKRILGDKADTERDMCEKIIVYITLISDKKRLEARIRREFGDKLSDGEIKELKGLNYTGWGRLSERFLNGIICPQCADENGEPYTVIRAMRERGENLMQLLSDKYGFKKEVDRFNEENSAAGGVTYNAIEELYCSPAVKRGIWRTVELIREIIKICGAPPAKVFIETTRQKPDEKRKGVRTVSRKQQILDLYKNIRIEERDWINEIEVTQDTKFNSDKLVLYYRQMGRSMYSGKPIRLDQVFDTNVCDIDHIYPQSKIKDDSLDNRVLVFKTENAAKGDSYPLSDKIRAEMYAFWRELKDKGLISDKKFERLTRRTPLTDGELADFINRQLVFTGQSVKAAAGILKQMLPETEIVYSKAALANEFKDKFKIVKVRELNDLHHARDAYVNIVAGNVYNTKFGHNPAIYYQAESREKYNLKYIYERDIPGAWKVSEKERIVNTALKNTCRAVRMSVTFKGALFDRQPVPKGKNEGLVPLKGKGKISDTSKYGGYNKATTAYFMLVKSTGKKGTLISLEAYLLYREKLTGGSKEDKLNFLKEQGLVNPEILLDRIKLKTLFKIDGSYAYLSGRTGKQIIWWNANQLFLKGEEVKMLKSVSNYMRDCKKYNKELDAGEDITAENNLTLYDAITDKLGSPLYSGLPVSGQAKFLREKRELFAALKREEQCRVLFEMLKLTQCKGLSADFTLLKGPGHAGINLTNKFMQDREVKIIFQSPTGYYRRVIDIKEFL